MRMTRQRLVRRQHDLTKGLEVISDCHTSHRQRHRHTVGTARPTANRQRSTPTSSARWRNHFVTLATTIGPPTLAEHTHTRPGRTGQCQRAPNATLEPGTSATARSLVGRSQMATCLLRMSVRTATGCRSRASPDPDLPLAPTSAPRMIWRSGRRPQNREAQNTMSARSRIAQWLRTGCAETESSNRTPTTLRP